MGTTGTTPWSPWGKGVFQALLALAHRHRRTEVVVEKAVEVVTALGKTVYAVSPSPGAQLGAVVKAFIRLERNWFDDCF